jgi:hypothetical protein
MGTGIAIVSSGVAGLKVKSLDSSEKFLASSRKKAE